MYSPAEDVKLGAKVKSQIEADTKDYPISKNQELTAYVQSLVDQIIQSKEIKYKNVFAYKAYVIQDDNTVNAFCVPGGYIFVYTGLMKYLDNEASLAAVIAHEIGHAEARHSSRRMTQGKALEALAGLADKKNKNVTKSADAAINLLLLNNSRDDEYEADELSVKYLKSSKWYAGAMKYFFAKLTCTEKSEGGTLRKLFATHPFTKDRVDKVNEELKKLNIEPPREANLFYKEYQNTKVKLLN
jgi:predicted Zn-dependent protease